MGVRRNVLPLEFWNSYSRLSTRTATPSEYLGLCKLAIRLIDSGQTTSNERSEMAYALSGFTRAADFNKHTEAIRESFLDLEIPGYFDLNHDLTRESWTRLRQRILETDEADTREPLEMHSKNVPVAFAKHVHRLLAQQNVTERNFIDLCQSAIACFEKNTDDQVMQSNIAYHITDVWYRKPKLYAAKPLREIGRQFSEWEKPGSFHMDYILDKHSWEQLKVKIVEAHKKYSV
jgi:acyl-CoA-binding protein